MAIDALKIRIDANRGRSITQDATLGGAVTIGNAVYVAADGDIEAARANAAATSLAIGLLVQITSHEIPGDTVGAAGDKGTVVIDGAVYCSGWGLTPGAIYYLSSATAGVITATAPTGAGTWTRVIGYAWDADTLIILPGAVAPVSNS